MFGKTPPLVLIGLGAVLLSSGCVEDGDPLPEDMVGDGDQGDGDQGDGDQGDGDPGDGDTDGTDPGDGDPTATEPPACNPESPYMGGWDIGCCQDEQVPSAWSPGGVHVGTVMPDWTLNDQFGDAVRLYDFCHDAIYFEYVALW